MNKRRTGSIFNFNTQKAIVLSSLLALNSCSPTPKHNKSPKAPTTKPSLPILQSKPSVTTEAISLFDINEVVVTPGDTAIFIDVSGVDSLPPKAGQHIIPDLTGKKAQETRYFKLGSKYRKRLLTGTGITEADSLFVYDYARDILLSFPVSKLTAVASLSFYEDASADQHAENDYMLGFKVDRAALANLNNDYFTTTYAYIGVKNPFTRGQMRPVIWEESGSQKIPLAPMSAEDAKMLKEFKPDGTYTFKSDGYRFYLRKYSKSESPPFEWLLICNGDNTVLDNEVFYETESSSPAPLSFAGEGKNSLEQWTGHLFKNRPPVILDFDDHDFGCPVLPYIDGTKGYVEIACDNRH